MIPHSSAGVQPWAHQSHTLNNNTARSLDGVNAADRSVSATEKLPGAVPMPQSDQTVIDLTSGEPSVQENERPAKRQKLDAATGTNVRSTEGKSVSSPAAWRSAPLAHRARPAWSFQELVAEAYPGNSTANESRNPSSALPFPIRPWKYTPLRQSDNTGGSRETSPERQVQTTPYHLDTPSVAPVLKGEKVADFSPWSGNHPEDVLNEQAAKQGHYDRTQVSQNESNTARPSLYAQLRHRSGLQVLSSVFAAALEKRQTSSKLSAASTFKPPPRVTLTDNKREAWLRDLANPNVPLRRLSRTIPHGVRGKLLLDQCLSKSIPIGRAVWLAKCVGANEIRAFKRKGTSGTLALGLEVKWIRDWTTNVHLFIEGVLSGCGDPQWKAKVAYAVRLTARLYFEHLLDQDQHLDWFLYSLEAASQDDLPTWLMILGVYWSSIVPFRRRGRKLMEILLEKVQHSSQTAHEGSMKPISHRLAHLIRKLVYEQSSSAVIPRSWDKYRTVMSSCLATSAADETVFRAVASRNSYLQRSKGPSKVSERSPLRQIVISLDSACSTYDINATSEACLSVIDDKEGLIARVLEWCSTSFRHGLVRVYIAIRLLRKWRRSGMDTDHHIFSFLLNVKRKAGLHIENVYHVISELVRSQTFSVGRYLQLLIAKGIVDSDQENGRQVSPSSTSRMIQYSDNEQEVYPYVELLRHIPVGRLPEHVCSLRNTLMLRAGFRPSDEGPTIDALKSLIGRLLPDVFGTETRTDADAPDNKLLLNQTHAVRSEIGQWIRTGVSRRSRSTPAR
ncbi:RNA polymerase II mediator complex subunit [Paecilomyces lecythidis]